jgi:DNA helicase-2/ATP-dependent DNA helicase PcrA
VKLEQTYRSTKTILAIASKLIANNTQRKDKSLWTENAQGERAKLLLCQDEHDEANIVMQQLKAAQEAGTSWSDMAIFYRMNSLSRVMEDALRRANVPYVMARGVEFYNRKVIKDVLAYLRVIANPADEVSLTRIVNVPPRGIGDSSVKLMQTHAVAGGMTLWAAMERAAHIPELSSRAVNSTKAFVELVNSWRAKAATPSPTYPGERAGERGDIRQKAHTDVRGGGAEENNLHEDDDAPLLRAARPSPHPSPRSTEERELELADPHERGPLVRLMEDVVRRSGLEAALKKAQAVSGADDEGNDPLANVNELISSVAEFEAENPQGTLTDYLAQVSLVSDTDHMKGHGGAVTLMTLHAAKGLEFPVVAIIGLEEGILPHSRARGTLNELEEERRLCFVGVTRAEQKLILSKAAYRTIRGLRERTVTSPFLNEMPADALEVTDRTGLAFEGTRAEYRERLETESDRLAGQFRKGQLVRHPTFGLGRIAEVSDMGQHTRAVIEFNAAGRKTLILQYARLEAVG